MSQPLSLLDVNTLAPAEFVSRFGDIAEHSPWVAEHASAMRP